MTSTTYDDDVDFETEEETSEFEEELDDTVNTITVKLPSQTLASVSQKTKKAVSSSEPDVLTTASKTLPHEVNGSTISDESSTSKKSSKVKVPKESSERIIENGYDAKHSMVKSSKPEILSECEKADYQSETKEIVKEKSSSKIKTDSDVSDEVTSSKKHKEKSEKRKSREESKKMLSEVGSIDEVEVSVKKSSKSKRDKNLDQDESSASSKKRDKYADEEGYTSKSKKDKSEKTPGDEMSSALQFVGEGSEAKEKKKRKKSALESESKYLETPSYSSPSSSSSDLEKLKNENAKTEEINDQSKVVKVTKKKSKKAESNEVDVDVVEQSTVVEDAMVQIQKEDSKIDESVTSKCLENEEEELKTAEDDKLEIEKICEKYKDEEIKSTLCVEPSQKERDLISPDHINSGSVATGRIEQTRNYLKALTPEDGYRSGSDDEKPNPKTSAVFEIAKREELEEENKDKDKDGKDIVWESKPEPVDESKSKIAENEDSDFTYRRKSMDDFIKKILAEAREENLKLKDDNEKARKPPTPKAKPQTIPADTYRKDEEEFIENKSKKTKSSDNQPIEVNKELDDINKYFAKRHEEMDGDLNIENSSKSKLDKELNIKENGYLGKDELDDDEFTIKHKKTQLSSYLEDDENKKPKQPLSTHLAKKPTRNALMNGDASYGKDDDLDETADITDFLAKFKRERQVLFGGPGAARIREFETENKRNAETEDLIRDKTRNIKSVIDQQLDICQNVRSVSKQLDDLEKELREVRQISLDRRSRMESMENAVNAEYKMYEMEHQAALDRVKDKKPIQKFTQEVKDQMIANIQQQQAARAKKTDRYLTSDDVTPSIRRRVGSVSSQAALMDEQDNFFLSSSPASSSPYHSFAPSKGRGSTDRDPYLSSYLTVDRKRDGSGGSRSRLSFVDNGSDFDDLPVPSAAQSSLFNKPRSRASVATMDTSSSISADDFLAKMRSKYSFMSPAGDDNSSNRLSLSSKTSAYRPMTSGLDSYRSRLEEPSSLSYLSVKNNSGRVPSSIYDTPGSRHSLASGAGSRYSSLTRAGHTPSSYEPPKSRRASSVSDARSSVHFDRNLGGYTTGGYSGYGGSTGGSSRYSVGSSRYSDAPSQHYTPSHSTSSGGGEFKSRFLDKVREKRSSVGSSSSSHDLADRVRARLNSSKSTASYDLPTPPSSTKQTGSTSQPAVSVESSAVEAN